ncbi:MAG: dephospho-CoA kinase [Bacteroidales bacterium]|jgi:dephospho-CoA kinase|nr:dephospho-CoA kinase [Bacteroidales bacterium]
MLTIALTGGMGCGKSFVAQHFLSVGIPVFFADHEAKKCYENPKILEKIQKICGHIVFEKGQLNLQHLSTCLFENSDKLQQINSLIHPIVLDRFCAWSKKQESPFVCMEAALIFETNLDTLFDLVIVVDASMQTRLRRVRQRNPTWTAADITRRINAQMPQEEKRTRATLILNNENDGWHGFCYSLKKNFHENFLLHTET